MSTASALGTPGPDDAASTVPADLLAGLFAPPVRFRAAPLRAGLAQLAPSERALVEKAVAARQCEFAQGRVLAHRLLENLGVADAPLLRDADRVPLWPAGTLGSISHTRGLCAVAVARTREVEALGLDVELATPLSAELRRRVCTGVERRWLEARGEAEAGALGKALFSVKECVYKACFPRLRERWGFQELEVEIEPGAGRFVAVPRKGAFAGRRLAGRVASRGRWWLAGLTLPVVGRAEQR